MTTPKQAIEQMLTSGWATADDQFETELHLLAVLLKRYQNVITVMEWQDEHSIVGIEDNSAELHKGIVLHVRPDR